MTDMVSPTVYPPASLAAVRAEEEKIGFALPELLREIYTEVGNGGFGPGYGLLGMSSGATTEEGNSIGELYASCKQSVSGAASWRWPKGLLPICSWGCAIYSCLDCTKHGAPVVIFDPNAYDAGSENPWAKAFIPHSSSFHEWLEAWLDGVNLWEVVYGSYDEA